MKVKVTFFFFFNELLVFFPVSIVIIFFVGLKSLDSLGLAHNKLKEVQARVFSHLTQLNSLELDGNSIIFIHPEAFYGVEGKFFSFL